MRRAPLLLTTLTAAALAVSAAPASAALPGSTNDRLVAKWYTDFLGRAPDEDYEDSGRDFWVGQLDAKQEPRRILEAILSSAEYADDTVDGYYEDYLGRDADDDLGANYWKSGIRADMEPEWVEQNVLASPEYERRTGDRRVERWYQAILGRGSSSGERVLAGPREPHRLPERGARDLVLLRGRRAPHPRRVRGPARPAPRPGQRRRDRLLVRHRLRQPAGAAGGVRAEPRVPPGAVGGVGTSDGQAQVPLEGLDRPFGALLPVRRTRLDPGVGGGGDGSGHTTHWR